MSERAAQQIETLAKTAESDTAFLDQMKADPVAALKAAAAGARTAPNPLEWDTWIYRIVVSALGLIALAAVGGGIALVAIGKTVPEILIALGSASVGAMAGLLAPSPGGQPTPS